MIATIAAITEKGQRSQGSYGNHSPAIAAIAAIVARASTHHAQSLPSFTVFTSSSYFALIKWVEGDKFKSQRQGKGSTPIHYKLAICHGLKLAFVNKFHSFFHSTFFCSNSIAWFKKPSRYFSPNSLHQSGSVLSGSSKQKINSSTEFASRWNLSESGSLVSARWRSL